MGINIDGGGNVSMPHQLLSHPDINAGSAQVRAEGVAEVVGDEFRIQRQGLHKGVTVDLASHGDIHLPPETLYQPRIRRISVSAPMYAGGERIAVRNA